MSRLNRRRNLKTKTQIDPLKAPVKNTKSVHQTDISSFFKKEDDESSSDSLRLPEGALPSPDAAALPCSTSLCSDNVDKAQEEKVIECTTGLPDEKSQKLKDACKNTKEISKKKRNQKISQPVRNSQITDFYPVRRSSRKPLPKMLKEKQKIIEDAILTGKEDGFEIKEFPGKGRGIVTISPIKRGEFVLEYSGELIDYDEALKREEIYASKEDTGCYMYYFKAMNKRYCIDATTESGRLGRLVNHSKKGNLRTQPFYLEESPRLALFASRDIEAGEELTYDYGDRSRQALESHPWLAL